MPISGGNAETGLLIWVDGRSANPEDAPLGIVKLHRPSGSVPTFQPTMLVGTNHVVGVSAGAACGAATGGFWTRATRLGLAIVLAVVL